MPECNICPRKCGANRDAGQKGVCRSPSDFSVSKIMLHNWEEPCLVGDNGAGTIFFSGCNLGCIYCQNRKISRGDCGETMTLDSLESRIFHLVSHGASCIEFVTPTHYTERLALLLSEIKHKLPIPTVYNCGGYESRESLQLLDGLIDIYMPDFKYFSPNLARKYSGAPDYADIALTALKEMLRQTGAPKFFENDESRLHKGVIVRHLILPSHRKDSCDVLELISREIGSNNIILSLMGQYTPDFYIEYENKYGKNEDNKNLRRRITSFEYTSVLSFAQKLGFKGYMQDISSSSTKYTPDF